MALEAFNEFSSTDIEDSRAHMSNVFSDHHLVVHDPSAMSITHNFVQLQCTALSYLEYGTNVSVAPAESQFFVVHVPTKGSIRTSAKGSYVVIGRGETMVSSPTEKFSIEYGDDNGTLLLRIPQNSIEQRLSVLLDEPLGDRLKFFNSEDSPRHHRMLAWIRQFLFLVQELEFGSDGVDFIRSCGEEMESSLINSLLLSHTHNYSDALHNGQCSVRPYYVKAAERFIREMSDEPITIDDIVEASGMSKRALYLGFNRFRKTTPLQFVHRVRLEKVYQDIASAGPSDNVTRLASQRGFTQLGRFSSQFRSAYGILPSELLRQVQSRQAN